MIYAYIRVSSDKQSMENQRFETLKYAHKKKIHIDQWIEETISGARKVSERQLGNVLSKLGADDILIVAKKDNQSRDSITDYFCAIER